MYLKGLAHSLKPILYVGKEGANDAARHAVEQAFNTRELLKIKVQEAAPESARESAAQVAAGLPDVYVVQVIGRTIVLYRRHPASPRIELPPSKGPSTQEKRS